MLLRDIGSPNLAFVWFVIVTLEGGDRMLIGGVDTTSSISIAANIGDEFGCSRVVVRGCFGV